jgi:uncharacterized protein YdhG (YjbR/CyaY superfamily)
MKLPKAELPSGTAGVEAYLADVPEAHRAALQALREQIRVAAPDAVEVITYQMPGFKHKGKYLVAYASFKAHCSMFPGGVAENYRDRLPDALIRKGTIQFTPDKPLPADVVRDIIRDRVAEIDAGGR